MEGYLTVRKGAWTEEEDVLLRKCIEMYGEGKWHLAPLRAGLNRCRKSCRLRWLNYLKPNIKRGEFTADEVDLIVRFHKLLGNRWSLIAARLLGRTANDVKNYWNTHQRKKLVSCQKKVKDIAQETVIAKVVKPQPRTFPKSLPWSKEKTINVDDIELQDNLSKLSRKVLSPPEHDITSWERRKSQKDIAPKTVKTTIIKPRPHTFSKNLRWFRGKMMIVDTFQSHDNLSMPSATSPTPRHGTRWLESQKLVENIALETIAANMIERQAKSISKDFPSLRETTNIPDHIQSREYLSKPSPSLENDSMWWESLFDDKVGERTACFVSESERMEVEEIAPVTKMEDTVVEEHQNCVSDFSLDVDVWDLLNSV